MVSPSGDAADGGDRGVGMPKTLEDFASIDDTLNSRALAELVFQTHRRLRTCGDQAMSSAGLSVARGKLLNILRNSGPLTPAEIAASLGQAPRTIISALNQLIVDGLVSRNVNPADGRSYLVSITSAGSDALESAGPALSIALDRLFSKISPRQRRQFCQILNLIRA